MSNTDKVFTYDISLKVKVRKYFVDKDHLVDLLVRCRKGKCLNCQQISDYLNISKTKVEHWFRKDTYFAVPDAEYWYDLKKLLDINTDEFDLAITEYEFKDSVWDMSNRVYLDKGLAPTLDTGCDKLLIVVSNGS